MPYYLIDHVLANKKTPGHAAEQRRNREMIKILKSACDYNSLGKYLQDHPSPGACSVEAKWQVF